MANARRHNRQRRSPPQLHIYDIVTEWRRLTNLPAVLAIWAARNDSFPNNAAPADRFPTNDLSLAEVIADFQASRDFGLTQSPKSPPKPPAKCIYPKTNSASTSKKISTTPSTPKISKPSTASSKKAKP